MPNWELFTIAPHKGAIGNIATISGDSPRPILAIGRRLRDMEFDITKRYDLLFDRTTRAVGLRESTKEHSYRVSKIFTISLAPFCRHFGIKVRMAATKAYKDGDTWVLEMAQTASK